MNYLHKIVLLLVVVFFLPSIQVKAQNNANNSNITNGQITCFIYHRFGDSRYPSTNISVTEFRNHMTYLKENNYNVVTLNKALELLVTGKTVPEKTVVLTIDDGYKSFLENGMPLLREFGFKATLFINTKQFGSGDFLSVKEIRQLINEGIEVENHSHSHAHFVNFSSEELADTFRNDLTKSEEIFMKNFGFKPRLYAWPYGEYTPEMQKILKDEGYIAAFAQKSGVVSILSDPYALPRFPVAGSYANLDGFVNKLKMKAMPVQTVKTINPVIQSQNPPELQLKVVYPEKINTSVLQFFVAGKKDGIIEFNPETNIITAISKHPLHSRRTLYTITAPSKENASIWHWYSFLWINNNVEE